MRSENDKKTGGRKPKSCGGLENVGTASKVVRMETEARAHVEVIEIVEK